MLLDHPLQGVVLMHSTSLPSPRVFSSDTHILWTGAN